MAEQIFYAVAITIYCAVFVWLFVCAVWRTIDEQRKEADSDESGREVGCGIEKRSRIAN